MNKNIYKSVSSSPIKLDRPTKHDKSPHMILRSQIQTHLGKRPSQNYLDTEMSTPQCYSQSKGSKQRPSRNLYASMRKQTHLYNKYQHPRNRQKRLIIEDFDDKDMHKNTISYNLSKNQSQQNQFKIRSFSSQKKTSIKNGFQVSSPPKRIMAIEQQQMKEDDNRCMLIRTILRRYKDQQDTIDVPNGNESPYISIVKCKERSTFSPHQTNQENVKFFGKRGCPPSKLVKQFYAKRQRQDSKASISDLYIGGVTQKCLEEISPWHITEEYS